MATDIPRIHKWWQQPSPNNDYSVPPSFAPTLTLENIMKKKSKKKKKKNPNGLASMLAEGN